MNFTHKKAHQCLLYCNINDASIIVLEGILLPVTEKTQAPKQLRRAARAAVQAGNVSTLAYIGGVDVDLSLAAECRRRRGLQSIQNGRCSGSWRAAAVFGHRIDLAHGVDSHVRTRTH